MRFLELRAEQAPLYKSRIDVRSAPGDEFAGA